MTHALRTIALAAAATTGLAARTALAWDDHPPQTATYPVPAYAAPVPPQGIYDPPPGRGWRARSFDPGRRFSWEEQELAREYRQLDWARARFYQRWGHGPWQVARFDAWYGYRRAELDRRWAELCRRGDDWREGWNGREDGWHGDCDDD